jgi:hypothetical protein
MNYRGTKALAGVLALGLIAAEARAGWQFTRVADTSTAAPGGTGAFTSFTDPSLNNGYLVFAASSAGGRQGIYELAPGGSLSLVADTSTAAPRGGTFASFERPSVDASGNVAFVATTTTGAGVFESVGGTLSAVARAGDATPGFAGTFSTMTNLGSASISNGVVAFSSFSAGSGGGSDQGIYDNAGGTLASVADRATAFPFGSGTASMIFIDRPTVNNGNLIFSASNGSQQGVYGVVGGTLTRFVDSTTTLPGSAQTFALEGSVGRGPVLAGGRTAFFSDNAFNTATGYYGTDTGGTLKNLVTFGNTPGVTLTGIGNLSLDPSGAFAVYGSNSSMTSLLYSPTFGGGTLQKIISFTDTLDGRTVQSPSSGIYALSGNQFAFDTTFSNGSSGVYLAAVPEPSSFALTATGLCALGLAALRRRRGGGR